MAVTMEDAWKHVSNKIANKANNIWEDLDPMIIPIDADDNFMKPITCGDQPEYGNDSYDMIRALCWNTDLLPTGTFLYVCPGRSRELTKELAEELEGLDNAAEVVNKLPFKYILVLSLVHPMKYVEEEDTWTPDIESGVYWVEKNEFQHMPSDADDKGQLPMALGALSLKWAIDNDAIGEVGRKLGEALDLTREAFEKARSAFGDVGHKL